MSFLYPAFLIGGLAMAIPIALHLLRRDVAPEVPFTAVRLLQRSPVERADRRRLRDLLLLLARVAALLLLAAAFARPYLRSASPAGVLVVAVDRSYSMGGSGRFAQALDRARAAIGGAQAGEQIAVVAFDDRADVLAAPGGAADARAALDGVAPGYGGTRYNAVVHKALDLAAGTTGRIVMVTDLQQAGWEGEPPASLPAGWRLEVEDIGAPPVNVAVTSVSVEAERVVATLHNGGTTAATGRAHVKVVGAPAGGDRNGPDRGQTGVRPGSDPRSDPGSEAEAAGAAYSIPPGTSVHVPIAWRAPATGVLAVSVDDPEGLTGDNVRYSALGPHGARRALVVTADGPSGLYLSRALETSAEEEGGLHAQTVPGARVAAMSPDEVSNYSVVALLSTRGLERAAREAIGAHIRSGAGLFVAAGPNVEASVLATLADWQPALGVAERPEPGDASLTLAATDMRHPIFRPFGALATNLGQVRFDRTWKVEPSGWTVMARFSDGTPALLERALGQGRVVLFASDVDRRWNDFPLHPSFVPFALEAMRYLTGDRQQPREYTVAQAPAGTGPGPGVYTASDARVVAVNVDPRESALDRLDAAAFTSMVPRSTASVATVAEVQAQQTESRQSYWQYGLMVMMAALVAESFVGRA